MVDVYIVQSEDYIEDQMTYGVAASIEAAARIIKEFYPEDYNLALGDPVADGENWKTVGAFGGKPGECLPGKRTFLFTRYELEQ